MTHFFLPLADCNNNDNNFYQKIRHNDSLCFRFLQWIWYPDHSKVIKSMSSHRTYNYFTLIDMKEPVKGQTLVKINICNKDIRQSIYSSVCLAPLYSIKLFKHQNYVHLLKGKLYSPWGLVSLFNSWEWMWVFLLVSYEVYTFETATI